MGQPSSGTKSYFTDAAREAAAAARKAKRENADPLGLPELFIVRAGDEGFTWELRRFGGVVLQRGVEHFDSAALARAAGNAALLALRASSDLPTLKRERPQGSVWLSRPSGEPERA